MMQRRLAEIAGDVMARGMHLIEPDVTCQLGQMRPVLERARISQEASETFGSTASQEGVYERGALRGIEEFGSVIVK